MSEQSADAQVAAALPLVDAVTQFGAAVQKAFTMADVQGLVPVELDSTSVEQPDGYGAGTILRLGATGGCLDSSNCNPAVTVAVTTVGDEASPTLPGGRAVTFGDVSGSLASIVSGEATRAGFVGQVGHWRYRVDVNDPTNEITVSTFASIIKAIRTAASPTDLSQWS